MANSLVALRNSLELKSKLVKKLQDTLSITETTNKDLFLQLESRDKKMVELSDSIRDGLEILKLKENKNQEMLQKMKELDSEVESLRIELDQKSLALDLANANLAKTQAVPPRPESLEILQEESGESQEESGMY